jgi:hypothetical protein
VGSRAVAYVLSIVINFLISSETAHVHSKVTQAEVALKVISNSQATEASGKTAPETLEV